MNEELFQSALVPTPVKSEIVFQPEYGCNGILVYGILV